MIQLDRILCPTDFSEFSRHALDHAAAIAGWYGARLCVLHVSPTPPVIDSPAIAFTEGDRERLMETLKGSTRHLPSEIPLELKVEEAALVHKGILRQAEAIDADLIVMGSHGRSGFERFLLGSVAETVIRTAPCPTLVIPRRAADRPPDEPVQFHRILCAVDFSEGSTRALEHALSLAEESDARLTLLNVIEIPPELRELPAAGEPEINVDRVRAAVEADRLRRLRQLIPDHARAYCTVETSVHEGAAYREILSVARERHADLIVMGVRGRGALDLLVFGSNTARVARSANCPVLVVGGRAADGG
jgi:nucleotide-binding universal stress UspA family protein